MIRAKMYLKYARMNLQEAEAALQEDDPKAAVVRIRDTGRALQKAVIEGGGDAACADPEAARVALKLEALTSADPEEDGRDRIRAERLLSLAGDAFRAVHGIFVPSDTL